MQVLYKGKPADVWEVLETSHQPEWAQRAFAEKYLIWADHNLKVLMNGLNLDLKHNLGNSLLNIYPGTYAMYQQAKPGDYLDVTNHRIVTINNLSSSIK